MLNFRRLKQDFPSSILKEGRGLYEKNMVVSAKILHLTHSNVKLQCRVLGTFENSYQVELDIDRQTSTILDSNCDCPYQYDCAHLAAILFYLEEHLDAIVVEYSKEADLEAASKSSKEKRELRETFKEAQTKESARKGKKIQKEILQEYQGAAFILGTSPFFHSTEPQNEDKAELAVLFTMPVKSAEPAPFEIQLVLRLPYRSKGLQIPCIKDFLDAVRYQESIYIGTQRYYFTLNSFDIHSASILKMLMEPLRYPETKERNQRSALIDPEPFGNILSESYELAIKKTVAIARDDAEQTLHVIPCLYIGSLEEPLRFSPKNAQLQFSLEYLEVASPKILLNPLFILQNSETVTLEELWLFESAKPGIIYQNTYYRFPENIKRKHLRNLSAIRDMTIPQPLFGTFVENALPELMRFADVSHRECIEKFVTMPFVDTISAECDIHYLKGEMEAELHFVYGEVKIPANSDTLTYDQISTFVTDQGILARNLTEEQKIIETLFQGFQYEASTGTYIAKNDKKIVEFMTEVIPANSNRIKFNCPENLLNQFIYDETAFKLSLKETKRIDLYEVDLEVNGHLNGVTVDQLWECISSKRAFIELSRRKQKQKGGEDSAQMVQKILVLDLEKLTPVVQIFDELGIKVLDTHVEQRPLWSLTNIDSESFNGLPIEFSISSKLQEIQQQMLGSRELVPVEIPKEIKASLRSYQVDGVNWLGRLRSMHLSGILADDMGLGKTLQAIITVTNYKKEHKNSVSIVVCPTSLVHNWKEEFNKFNKNLKVLPVDGTPAQRKKLQSEIFSYDVVITSYSLLQKDIDFYQTIVFGYAILDEAQHIKNRGTRNAKSVKMIQAEHRLILTGTPIENSLEELWSLFDFLMPGLLSSYDRFVEKYVRNQQGQNKNLTELRRKLSPFILRRMKKDVLKDLPAISEIVYHCNLSETQRELYRSYANSAREELSQLVKKEGFDRIQIHVLATLTRLKQICCHPAIFAKEKAETGDSAKYEMLIELLQTLIEGKHKTVIFSQYTRMLSIMREDLNRLGIPYEYLDGSSKNRLSIVKKFNEDESIPVFLVSLKAGGSGLNLVGADTVIHYDMWWNPAVENQATDRVHRIGQKQSVSSYKLITLQTIEEKILELHNRKRGLVKKVVSCDEEAIAKLTWEEVLDLLQT